MGLDLWTFGTFRNLATFLRDDGVIISHNTEKGGMIMSKNTVRLHRVIRAPAERVYRAFLDPDAMAK